MTSLRNHALLMGLKGRQVPDPLQNLPVLRCAEKLLSLTSMADRVSWPKCLLWTNLKRIKRNVNLDRINSPPDLPAW